MWAHLCVIKPCFVFVKVLTQEQIRLLSSALSKQTATGTNCLLLRFDILLETDTETKEAWRGLNPSFTQTHTLNQTNLEGEQVKFTAAKVSQQIRTKLNMIKSCTRQAVQKIKSQLE